MLRAARPIVIDIQRRLFGTAGMPRVTLLATLQGIESASGHGLERQAGPG